VKKKRCYVAHNIILREYVTDYIIPKLEKYFEIVNPFSEKRLKTFKGLSWEEIENLVVDDGKLPRYIVQHDLNKIKSCDLLFAYIEQPSHGTDFEIWEAFRVLNLPVGVVVKDKKYIKHQWLKFACISLGTFDEIDKIIENMSDFFDK
jgi:hypothetical protein